MLGSLPWEKLQDEGQQLQSVVFLHSSKDLQPYYQLPLHQHPHLPGEESGVSLTWGVCVFVSV